MGDNRRIAALFAFSYTTSMTDQEMRDAAAKEIYNDSTRKIAGPIKHIKDSTGKVVGFHTTGCTTKDGSPRLGNIWVHPAHRGKGYGYQAAKEFQDKNKNMAWFADEDNAASQGLAKKLGLQYTKRAQDNPKTMVFEKKANVEIEAFSRGFLKAAKEQL